MQLLLVGRGLESKVLLVKKVHYGHPDIGTPDRVRYGGSTLPKKKFKVKATST